MSQFKNELQMVNKTIKGYVSASQGSGVINNSRALLYSSNQLFESNSIGGIRDYTVYNLKHYPYFHSTKVGEELHKQEEVKYQVASSHGHNGELPSTGSDFFKNRKYHKKNEFKHGESFDNKPIYQHILKRNEIKTVSELKEDYRRMVEESKKNAPKMEQRETQEKMKDFSLGVD